MTDALANIVRAIPLGVELKPVVYLLGPVLAIAASIFITLFVRHRSDAS